MVRCLLTAGMAAVPQYARATGSRTENGRAQVDVTDLGGDSLTLNAGAVINAGAWANRQAAPSSTSARCAAAICSSIRRGCRWPTA